MYEIWLQKYIKEHFQEIGFSRINGPYNNGADFKGIYSGNHVKIEAEWDYTNYISHGHPPDFADILVVATSRPVPAHLKGKLPPVIINLDREKVIQWGQPKSLEKNKEDYHSLSWRRLSRSLLILYVHFQKLNQPSLEFPGSKLSLSANTYQAPAGFRFGTGGKEESYEGQPEEKADWDFWLIIAHSVANHFHLRPALLRPTWIDRIALYFTHTGRITAGESERFKEVAVFIDELLSRGEP